LQLYSIAAYDWADHLERLVFLGCDPETKLSEQLTTALHIAAIHNCKSVMTALLDMKVSVDPTDAAKYTPLLHAAESNHSDLLSLLLRAGANANHKAEQDVMALHIVAIKGNTQAAKELFVYGSEIEPSAGEHRTLTPLHLAAEHNHSDMIRLLVSRGANIE